MYMRAYVHVYVRVYVYVHVRVHTRMRVFVCDGVFACACVCICDQIVNSYLLYNDFVMIHA